MAAAAGGRTYDVVLLGVTGFTGRLVAEYFARNAKPSLRYALAGRCEARVAAVRAAIAADVPKAAAVPIITADSHNADTLDALTKATRVVISTVGPFTKYGSGLVEACVRNRTDYVDSTGETPWVRKMIAAHHEAARANGVCIVPMCGFDSIPSDLGTLMMVDHIRRTTGRGTASVTSFFTVAASFSGGTLSTIAEMFAGEDAAGAGNNKLLCLPGGDDWPDPKTVFKGGVPMTQAVKYYPEVKKYTSPFLMATANTAVVARSSYLAAAGATDNESYTKAAAVPFRYGEVMSHGSFFKALAVSIALTIGAVLMYFSLTRRFLVRFVLPAPGSGPSPERRAASFFRTRLVARPLPAADGTEAEPVFGEISGGDPGYDETAKMLSECAMALVENRDELPGRKGGVLTPASTFGMVLAGRLAKAGMTVKVDGE